MWADFLSHFQEDGEEAAYFEAEVEGNEPEDIPSNIPEKELPKIEEQVPEVIAPKNKIEGENSGDFGGSGGTTKIEKDED